MAVALHRLRDVRFLDVQPHAGPQHAVQAVDLRAVRVVGGLALGVVLAVDRGPLLGDHAGREPEPEAEEMRHDRMQVERAVRLVAVQVDRDRGDGDVRQAERDQREAPPGEIQQTVEEHQAPLLVVER